MENKKEFVNKFGETITVFTRGDDTFFHHNDIHSGTPEENSEPIKNVSTYVFDLDEQIFLLQAILEIRKNPNVKKTNSTKLVIE
jgi:hypothetical protein